MMGVAITQILIALSLQCLNLIAWQDNLEIKEENNNNNKQTNKQINKQVKSAIS